MKHFYSWPDKPWLYLMYLLFTLLLLLCWRPSRAQVPTYQLRGTVVSKADQTALVGANVRIKGSGSGVTAGKDGSFTLDVSSQPVHLVVSFIGYRSLDTLLESSAGKQIVFSLQPDPNMLEEVTVSTGYWETSKRFQTGNISKITAATIEKQPVSNVLQALQGRIAGLNVQQQTGVAGGGMRIRIRGTGSIASGNDPLFIVDGVPYSNTSLFSGLTNSIMASGNPFSSINPADIESIEILKDADATAIYGSRGANGVIIITTRRSRAGASRINVNLETGFSRVSRKMDLLSTPEYIQMRKQAYANDEMTPQGGFDGYDLLEYDTTRYTDWQKELIGGTARRTNLQASISAGNEYTSFVFGAGYYKEGSVFPGDFGYQKANGHLNLSHSSKNRKFQTSVSISYQLELNRMFTGDVTSNALQLMPNAPASHTPDGKLNWGPFYFNNPYSYMLRTFQFKKNNLINNLTASYEIVDGLFIKSSAGYTAAETLESSHVPIASFNPRSSVTVGSSQFGNGSLGSWILEPQLEYKKRIGQGQLTVLAGSTFQQNPQQKKTVQASGYTSDLQLENIQAAAAWNISESAQNHYKYNSVFGRINFVEKQKYLLNLTARRDGSSRFGPDNRFANFWAAGAGWIFSNEKLVKALLPSLTLGKLRASYGTTGNDQIADYGYLDSYMAASYPYDGAGVYVPSRLANPAFSWELTKKLEAALELGIWNGRLSLDLSYYRNRSSNQLVGYPLPALTGFTSIQSNLPAKIQNSGYEIELTSRILESSKLSWQLSANLTLPKTRLIDYPNLLGSSYANRYVIGSSLTLARVFEGSGVDPQTGLYTFKDVDGDGRITSANDQRQFIDLAPRFYGGLNNTFRMGGWQLDVFFQFASQDAYNARNSFNMPGTPSNQPASVLDRWTQTGAVTDVQKYSQNTAGAANTAYVNARTSTLSVTDGSYLRLKNVSLTYVLPASWSKRAALSESRLSLSAQNLLTWTKYEGLDVETQSFINLPTLRTVSLAINFTL